jgi:hypothetical protein
MTKNEGGPAFPGNIGIYDPGMSLRDWFAGQSIAGLLFMVSAGKHDLMHHGHKGLAEEAYRVADAMLKARKQ